MKWLAAVCAYDELPCLKALEPKLPRNTVFAVDGIDGSREFLGKRKRAVLFSRERLGKAAAVSRVLNYARAGRYDAIVFLQADNSVGRDFFREILKPLSNPRVGISVAEVSPCPGKPESFCGLFSRLNWQMHNRFGEIGAPKAGEAFAIRLSAAPPEIPREIINDDAFLQSFSEGAGFRTIYCPEAEVFLTPPGNLGELFSQRTRVARGHFQLLLSGARTPTVSPTRRLEIFLKTAPEVCGNIRELLLSVLAALFEVAAAGAGFFSLELGKKKVGWLPLPSTKMPIGSNKLKKK